MEVPSDDKNDVEMKEDSINERKSRDRDSVVEQIDKLEENFEELQVTVGNSITEINQFKQDFLSRATEKTIAHYIQMISGGLHRECGEKPYCNKMHEDSALAKYFQTDDSILLKDAAETLRDKLEIIGHNLINQKKFKKTAGHQIYQLEEQVKKFIKKEEFRREHEESETRIKEFVML